MVVDPVVERAEFVVCALQRQGGAELRLSTGTFEEDNQIAGHGERHGTAEIFFHERQRQIDPGRHAGRGPDRTVAHEDRIGLDAHGGKTLSQRGAVLPAMTEADIKTAIEEFTQSATNAMQAGFDGVELHGANGYLLEQFIRPTCNRRTDGYGGPIENRARFVLETAEAVIRAIGKEKVGIRLSPFGVFNDMPDYPEQEADYEYLAQQLNQQQVLYLHVVDHSSLGAPPVSAKIKQKFRELFKGALILSGSYDAARADKDLADGRCDLTTVGRPILANPDIIARWQAGAELNAPDMDAFYTPGPQGYTDYPYLS
jgi:N-ethylmaleimide reductase